MVRENRTRILELYKIFSQAVYNDAGISMDTILSILQDYEGNTYNRKSIYKDIEILNTETNLKIEYDKSLKIYKAERRNTLATGEIEIITNALYAAKFLSKDHTKNLINKLYNTIGLKFDTKVLGQLDRNKDEMPEFYQDLDLIREALNKNRKVKFDYIKYRPDKTKFVDKKDCLVSPYFDVWYQDKYYMLGSYDDEHISHYRIDRMSNISIMNEKRKPLGEIVENFNIGDYLSKSVGLSKGDEETVTIQFKNEHMSEVIDALGNRIRVLENKTDYFVMNARVFINKKFISWILSFGEDALVEKPEILKQRIKESAEKLYADYFK